MTTFSDDEAAKLIYYRATEKSLGSPRFYLGNLAFPVLDDCELQYLSKLCDLYDVEIQEVVYEQTKPGVAPSREGVVACIDLLWIEVARFYSALTGRGVKYVNLTALSHAITAANVKVLIFNLNSWTARLIHEIQPMETRDCSRPIGLIPSFDLPDAYRECVRRAAALHLSEAAFQSGKRRDVAEILMEANLSAATSGAQHILGRMAPQNIARDTISGGFEILAISTHGDGFDSPLPSGLVLCSQLVKTNSKAIGTAPVCAATRLCHRLGYVSTDDETTPLSLVSPSELSARIIFFRACNVLPPRKKLGVQPGSMIGMALLRHASYSCFISAVEIVFNSAIQIHAEVSALNQQGTVGQAWSRLCDLNTRASIRPRLFCFGDPATKICSKIESTRVTQVKLGKDIGTTTIVNQRRAEHIVLAQIFLRGLQETSTNGWLDQHRNDAARTAWERAFTALSAWKNRVDSEETMRTIDDSLAQCLPYIRKDFIAGWLEEDVSWQTAPPIQCPHCREESQSLILEIRNTKLHRHIINCPNCGLSRDTPLGVSSGILISAAGVVRLRTTEETPPRRYFVRVHSHQRDGPTINEISSSDLQSGTIFYSPFMHPVPGQLSVITLESGLMIFDSRNVASLASKGNNLKQKSAKGGAFCRPWSQN